jgi:SOS-response transcriptional repressor LexA
MTPDQLRLLDFIREEIHAKGVSPSIAEMTRFLGRKSDATARGMVDRLVWQGALIRTGDRSRGLKLPMDVNVAGIPTARLEAELRRRGRQPAWSREFLAGLAGPQFPLTNEGPSHG